MITAVIWLHCKYSRAPNLMLTRISLSTLFLIVTACAVLSAVFLQTAWNKNSLPFSEAPPPVVWFFEHELELKDTRLDLRRFTSSSDLYESGCIWRIPTAPGIQESHKRKFGLVPIAPDAKNRDRMLLHIPPDWRAFDQENSEWHAGSWNSDGDTNLGVWYIMVVCPKTEMIYFFYSCWNYTP